MRERQAIGDRIPNTIYRFGQSSNRKRSKSLSPAAGEAFVGMPLWAFKASILPIKCVKCKWAAEPADDPEKVHRAKSGIKLNKQTILHNAESKSFAERRTGLLVSGTSVELPTVDFEHLTAKANPMAKDAVPDLPPNPIRASMDIHGR